MAARAGPRGASGRGRARQSMSRVTGSGVTETPVSVSVAQYAPPSSVVVNTQGLESGGSWFETCSGVWYPRRRPCGVAINTSVDLIIGWGNPKF